jgi:hypothetical protein
MIATASLFVAFAIAAGTDGDVNIAGGNVLVAATVDVSGFVALAVASGCLL